MTNGGAAWRRNHYGEQRRGACSNIPGWWRCTARKSTWSISCDKYGIGRTKNSSKILRFYLDLCVSNLKQLLMTHYGDEKKTCRHSHAERLAGHEAWGLALDNILEQSGFSPMLSTWSVSTLLLCGLVGYPFKFIWPGSLPTEYSVLTD